MLNYEAFNGEGTSLRFPTLLIKRRMPEPLPRGGDPELDAESRLRRFAACVSVGDAEHRLRAQHLVSALRTRACYCLSRVLKAARLSISRRSTFYMPSSPQYRAC